MKKHIPLDFGVSVAHVAVRYGYEEAGFLNQLMYWYRENRVYDRNFYDGRWWTWNSIAAYEEKFPWWSGKQLRRIIDSCKKQGAILTANYNENKRDRTVWYAPSDELLAMYGDDLPPASICPNGQMHLPKRADPFAQMGEPLPKENQNNIPPIVPQGGTAPPKRGKRECKAQPDWRPERFEGFWKYYPRHENKQGAIRAWDKLQPGDELINRMGVALKRLKASASWRDGIGIPHASTWLNNARWEDADELPSASDRSNGWADDEEII